MQRSEFQREKCFQQESQEELYTKTEDRSTVTTNQSGKKPKVVGMANYQKVGIVTGWFPYRFQRQHNPEDTLIWTSSLRNCEIIDFVEGFQKTPSVWYFIMNTLEKEFSEHFNKSYRFSKSFIKTWLWRCTIMFSGKHWQWATSCLSGPVKKALEGKLNQIVQSWSETHVYILHNEPPFTFHF